MESNADLQRLAETLQYDQRYENYTINEIINMFDHIDDLRSEVQKSVKRQHSQLSNMYDTRLDDLAKQSSIITGQLDMNYQILLNLDEKELSRNCRTNKGAINICSNKNFWIDKFKHDGLDSIYHFNGK